MMPDGEILKTPPRGVPFRFIISDELDTAKSLKDQAIMDYETWLKRTPDIISPPQRPDLPALPEMFQIPPHLIPEVYEIYDGEVYIYADENTRCKFTIEHYSGNVRIKHLKKGMVVKNCIVIENGFQKVYFYITPKTMDSTGVKDTDLMRKQKYKEREYGKDTPAADIAHIPEKLYEIEDEVRLIKEIIETLPPLQRSIMRLKDIEEYETEEIAQITGCSPEAIRKNLSRARKNVREIYLNISTNKKKNNI